MKYMISCVVASLLSVAGCPMPGAVVNFGTAAAATSIPAGTYRGEATFVLEGSVNGQEIPSQTDTYDDLVIIDDDGRPINTTTGQAWKVGDVNSSSLAGANFSATTTSVTSSGNTIVEKYDVVWNQSGVRLTGQGIDTYVYTGSVIDVQYSFSVGARRPADDALMIISYTSTSTLTK